MQAAQLRAALQQLEQEFAAHTGQVAEAQGRQVARAQHQACQASVGDGGSVLQNENATLQQCIFGANPVISGSIHSVSSQKVPTLTVMVVNL